MSPLHLALDTSTSRPVAALLQGENCLREWIGSESMRHHETLLGGIHECLSKGGFALGDLTHLSVGIGPGMFTGLRIGITTAKFLADPLRIPCVAVSSLMALALQSGALEKKIVWAVSDARSKRVYALRLAPGETAPDFSPPPEEEVALTPEEAAKRMQPGDFLIGEGAELYAAAWPEGTILAESGKHLLLGSSVGRIGARRYALGLTVSAGELQPKYLKTGQSHL
jgi:tRNA threonylcarbamoyl adenosine modification protein YeaZ